MSVSVVAVAIVSRDNKPLAIRTKYDFVSVDDSQSVDHRVSQDDERLKLVFLMNSSLDFVDEKQNTTSHRDTYLGLLCQLESYKIYALLTASKTKILLILSSNQSSARDSDVRHMLKNLQSMHTQATACNPFHVTGTPIKSPSFDSRIRSLFLPHEASAAAHSLTPRY